MSQERPGTPSPAVLRTRPSLAAPRASDIGVLLLESRAERRHLLAEALRRLGLPVVALGSIREVHRWPTGDIVIAETRRFTPWWKEVGALHVIVLADSCRDGEAAMAQGAALWLPRTVEAEELSAAVRGLLPSDCVPLT